jgi:DNA polymerase I
VLRNVVKTDVASMYPSLIRHERIGPKSDTLGVFLHLMDHLTGLRLEHKAAARRGDPGEHDAMQSAMKLVINAGYGYTGSGRMAVFGDVEAANTVTRRGRETLKLITDSLQQRGVTLIEADTDGVYFSVPEDWTEQNERQVIAEVDALLPSGITLEFDGRWAAMLSHETKNYALLGYDGELELKGAAFTSSRGERYGREFLQEALQALLHNDIGRIPHLYRSTVQRIETGGYTNAEMASRIRVTKTQDEYLRTRASRQDAVYEALMRSQRSWKSGDRITLYKCAGAGLRVLDEPDGCNYDAAFYVGQLLSGYASRLKKGLSHTDFQQLFAQEQVGLFDAPLEEIRAVWKRVSI